MFSLAHFCFSCNKRLFLSKIKEPGLDLSVFFLLIVPKYAYDLFSSSIHSDVIDFRMEKYILFFNLYIELYHCNFWYCTGKMKIFHFVIMTQIYWPWHKFIDHDTNLLCFWNLVIMTQFFSFFFFIFDFKWLFLRIRIWLGKYWIIDLIFILCIVECREEKKWN